MLTEIDFSESCNHSSQAIAPPLRRIRCDGGPFLKYLMDWFCRHPTPSVHTLEILRLHTDVDISAARKFIQHLGSALENLTISCVDRGKCISNPYFIDTS